MIKFVLPQYNSEKLINNLIKKYKLFNIKKENNNLIFYCKIKDKNKIKKILNKNSINPVITINTGFANIFNYFSIGIITGIIISLFIYIFSSFFITNIIIYGNINYTQSEIQSVLSSQNIHTFIPKVSVDIKELNNKIEGIDFVSYSSCIIKGNALVINIKEQLTNNEVVNLDNFEPLVSLYDGQITSVKLIQGTLNCKVGDIIKFGDVLVYPYVQNEDGTKLSVQPLADIVCDIWYTDRYEVKDVEIQTIRTGKQITNYEITCLGASIFKKENDNVFELYDYDEYETYLTTSLLPLKIIYKKYYECKQERIVNNFEENKQNFIDKCRSFVLLNLQDYDIIKNEIYDIVKGENFSTIIYTITISKKIF